MRGGTIVWRGGLVWISIRLGEGDNEGDNEGVSSSFNLNIKHQNNTFTMNKNSISRILIS